VPRPCLARPKRTLATRRKGLVPYMYTADVWRPVTERRQIPLYFNVPTRLLFRNRGVLHTVVGAFKPDEVRAFHECNLVAASSASVRPTPEDVRKYA